MKRTKYRIVEDFLMIPSVLDKNKIQNPAFPPYTVKAINASVSEIHFMKFLHMTSLFKSGAQ
jgi:hypothetical protein